jgi:hypothetical protein
VERFREFAGANRRPENEDLERAIIRSAILADIFCLSDGLPTEWAGIGPLQQFQEHFRKVLPQIPFKGIFSQAEELTIRVAISACEKRLNAIEHANFDQPAIDPLRLVLPARGYDYGAGLALEALRDMEQEHQTMPARVQTSYKARWFATSSRSTNY